MTEANDVRACGNCHREFPAPSLDRSGWCTACRHEVVRRATLIARILAGVGGVLTGIWVVMVAEPGSRFVLMWLILVGAVYYILYKLVRRVSFEVIQSRGVRPPKEDL